MRWFQESGFEADVDGIRKLLGSGWKFRLRVAVRKPRRSIKLINGSTLQSNK